MLIFCSPLSKSSTFDNSLFPPSSLFTRFTNCKLDYSISLSKSTSFRRLTCAFSRFLDLFCKVRDFMYGRLINSQQFLTFVSPNSLQSTYNPLSSRQAQPTVWYYSSRYREVVNKHLIMEVGVMHSMHSNRINKRSPESILDMMVSSAWNPQLIPKLWLVNLEASLRVYDFMAQTYLLLFQVVLQWMKLQPQPVNTKVVIVRSLAFLAKFLNI